MVERTRVLPVDDEAVARVLKTTLQSQWYEVKTAAAGETKLEPVRGLDS